MSVLAFLRESGSVPLGPESPVLMASVQKWLRLVAPLRSLASFTERSSVRVRSIRCFTRFLRNLWRNHFHVLLQPLSAFSTNIPNGSVARDFVTHNHASGPHSELFTRVSFKLGSNRRFRPTKLSPPPPTIRARTRAIVSK